MMCIPPEVATAWQAGTVAPIRMVDPWAAARWRGWRRADGTTKGREEGSSLFSASQSDLGWFGFYRKADKPYRKASKP